MSVTCGSGEKRWRGCQFKLSGNPGGARGSTEINVWAGATVCVELSTERMVSVDEHVFIFSTVLVCTDMDFAVAGREDV